MQAKNIFIVAICLIVALTSCRKVESDVQGCMDSTSLNYDPRATVDDGSCTYYDLNYTLWSDGKVGVWGTNESTEDMQLSSCKGNVDTMVFNNGIDSSMVLFFERDTIDFDAAMLLTTINNVDADEFKNGYVQFQALLPTNSNMSTFQVKICGTVNNNLRDCGSRYLSDLINVSTDVLNDSTFTTVQLPMVDFQKKRFVNLEDIMSIECINADTSASDTLLMIKNIQWFSN